MAKYRKKPVVIEAFQYTGEMTDALIIWLEKNNKLKRKVTNTSKGLVISTLEGDHLASKNDFIISGINGELYPCKPEIFNETYEQVEED